MNLQQQIINGKVEAAVAQLGIKPDMAFMRVAHSLITGTSLHSFKTADMVDGGQDKQLDIITIEQGEDEADVYVIGCKHTLAHSSNDIILLGNGLDWLLNKTKAELSDLHNKRFRDKITEYRSLQNELGPSNIRMHVSYISNGDTSILSQECKQEAEAIRAKYDNETFSEFNLEIMGCTELVNCLNAYEKGNRKKDARLPILYDVNTPSFINYRVEGFKGIVCTVLAAHIAELVNNDKTGCVFDSNIRRFLGTRGAINADIVATCSTDDTAKQFWFLNNGITIVCDSYDVNTNPDEPWISIKNLQIVNGCQTASALALAARQKKLRSDTRVMVRVYNMDNKNLLDRIVLTTNSQNKISSRDLHANDTIQIDMQRAFSQYGVYYERKYREFDDNPNVTADKIFVNEEVAQAFLAVVLKHPSDARRRKYKVWTDSYSDIFSNRGIETYILPELIVRSVVRRLSERKLNGQDDDLTRKIANNGTFHLARAACYLWRGTDTWDRPMNPTRQDVEKLVKQPEALDSHIDCAFKSIYDLINNSSRYKSDPDAALKSSALDQDIDKVLHQLK